MPHLDIQSGGERLLPFARKTLRILQEGLDRGGIIVGSKFVYVDSGATVFVRTLKIGGRWVDWIRITSGLSYLVNINVPFPVYTASYSSSSSSAGVFPNNVDTWTTTYQGFIDGVSEGIDIGGGVSSPTAPVTGNRLWTAANLVFSDSTFTGGVLAGSGAPPGSLVRWNGAAQQPNGPGLNSSTIPAYATWIAALTTTTVIAGLQNGAIPNSWVNKILLGSLDTPLPDRETITVVPYSPYVGGVDQGLYASHFGVTQAAIYGKAEFRYEFATNSLTFIRWTAAAQILNLTGAYPAGNFVIKYGRAASNSTVAFAKAQADRLAAPVTAEDKFFALIKTAVDL